MEDYKKKYEEALENLKRIKTANKDNKELVDFIEYKFPELKESEDEMIKEDIISLVNEFWERIGSINPEYSSRSKMLTWLEKQGVHANFRNKIQIGDEVTRNEDGALVNLSQFKRMVKQGEQEPADEIKPKFKVGDTIRLKGSTAEYTIESISGGCYHGKGWGLDIDCDEDYELVEQKPAWSEGDERMLQNILECLKNGWSKLPTDILKYESWLKALKERMKGE